MVGPRAIIVRGLPPFTLGNCTMETSSQTQTSSDLPPTPRRVQLKLADLVDAFEMGGDMLEQYLDLETGEVIPITDDIRSEMRAIEQDLPAHLEGDELRAAIIDAVENRG